MCVGMKVAWDKGYKRVEVEVDSKEAVKLMLTRDAYSVSTGPSWLQSERW